MNVHLPSDSPEQTREIGRDLGSQLRVGDVVALIGPLGAGKTQFVKGVAAGAGLADTRRVTSPTFVLINEYEGRIRLYHIDAYRLGDAREYEALGAEEFARDGAVLLEWADRVMAALPEDRLAITIEVTGEQSRVLHCAGECGRAVELLQGLARHDSE